MTKGKTKPRVAFERTLQKILDRCSGRVYPVEWTDDLPYASSQASSIKLCRLWVVGSFARGAAHCGDLDLVMQVRLVSGKCNPPLRLIPRTIIGTFPLVSTYVGTPERNTSNVAFPDAVLVWDGKIDSKAALAGIEVVADAGRFQRRDDLLPFRADQLGGYFEIDKLIEGIEQGEYSSQFIDESELPQGRKIFPELWERSIACSRYGSKTEERIRVALEYLLMTGGISPTAFVGKESCAGELVGGGWSISSGSKPVIHLGRLDYPMIRGMVITPHFTRRGPNGIWIIRPNHKDTDCSGVEKRGVR